jgi:hypothetical protein
MIALFCLVAPKHHLYISNRVRTQIKLLKFVGSRQRKRATFDQCILLCDMKYQLHTCFTEACVLYAPRGCNKPAHELTALGLEIASGDHVFWTMSYHSSVNRLVTSDRAMS